MERDSTSPEEENTRYEETPYWTRRIESATINEIIFGCPTWQRHMIRAPTFIPYDSFKEEGKMVTHFVNDETENPIDGLKPRNGTERSVRADAQRNINALLQSAMNVFADSGVDAPVREIAEKAGVGLGTVYRHFPQRSDLIVAVFRREVDACADAMEDLVAKYGPGEALARWMQRYVDFIGAKRGLSAALSSGNPAYESLPAYFEKRLNPALRTLLQSAAVAGEVRADVEPDDLLRAAASLCNGDPVYARRMVTLLVDGLRYRANTPS